MADVFCFSCGAATVALGQQVVPICANCRARGVVGRGGEANWMVRLPGGSSRGPLSKQAVIGWIARGRIGPDDRISPVGGEGSALADHPDFRGCFIPGSVDEEKIGQLRQEFRDVERRAKVRRILARAGSIGFFAVSAGMLYLGSQSRVLVLPVPILEQVEKTTVWWQELVQPPVQYQPVPIIDDLPHAEWVKAQGRDGDEASIHRGEVLLWTAPSDELESARRHFLAAIASSPLDPMAHAGLIETNSEMLALRPDLLGEIARASVRLDSLQAAGPGVDRAAAALALAKGNRLGAAEATKDCMQVDMGCRLIHGEATRSLDEIEYVRNQLGDVPRVLRGMARTAFAADDWLALESATTRLIEKVPSDPLGYELRAEHEAALGRWASARKAATRARELGSETPALLHLEAAITVQVDEDVQGGVALYKRLAEHPLISGYGTRLKVLIQSALVCVRVGDLDTARSMVSAASDISPDSAPVMMTKAMIEFVAGKQEAAESILRNLDTGDIDRTEEALIHLWSAYIYLDGSKQRLARTELDEVARIRPTWQRMYHEIVWAEFQAKNISNVIEAVKEMALAPPAGKLRIDPRENIGLGEPPLRKVTGPLLRAMDADIRYERLREPVAAILGWISRRPGALEHMLEANEDFPDNVGLQAAISAAQFEAGSWEEAVANALAVVGRLPNAKWMQSIRGRSLAKLGRWNEAKDVLRRSTRGDVPDVRLFEWAAETWIAEGDLGEGRMLLEQAFEASPNDVKIRRALLALEARKE